MDADTMRATLRGVLDLMEAGDWDTLRKHPGLYETLEHFPRLKAGFPDLRHTIESTWIDEAGDTISCVATIEGTHLGPYVGVPPTGRRVRFMVLLIDRIEDGRIVQHWGLPAFMNLFQQIGAVVGPASSVTTPQP